MFKENEISEILSKITEGNSLLKSVLTDEVLAEISTEQLDKIQSAILETDPKKIKEQAEEILKNYK
jgi:Glu-tRNA(Gln) amidotransferase subunit E-like FAD-binding protein